jgi:hypothetical protein
MWQSRPANGGRTNSPTSGAHTSPSWADIQRSGTAIRPAGTGHLLGRRSPVYWMVLVLLIALAAVPAILALRGPTPPLWVQLAWVAIIVAGAIILSRMSSRGAVVAARPAASVPERALDWTFGFIALVLLYGLWTRHWQVPLWFWGVCAALIALFGSAALHVSPRGVRRRISLTIYGAVIALCSLFPVAALPRSARPLALCSSGSLSLR